MSSQGRLRARKGKLRRQPRRDDHPPESASHVYTRDALSGMVSTSRWAEGAPSSEIASRVYTRNAISDSRGPRGSPPSNTSPRVYTRGGPTDIRPASRRRKAPSPSEFAHRVYTWDEILDAGHLEASGRPDPRRPRRGIGGLRMGRAARLPGRPAPPCAAGHRDPLPRAPSRGGGPPWRGRAPPAEGPLAADSGCAHFSLTLAATAARTRRASPAGSSSALRPWRQAPEVSARIGRRAPIGG